MFFLGLLTIIISYLLPHTSARITSTSVSSFTIPAPTASPLPPINPTAQTFLNELGTAFLYAVLIANGDKTGRDAAQICDAVNPRALSKLFNGGINGTAIKREICTAAKTESGNPELGAMLVKGNREGAGYLAIAVYAVQVVAGYAGGSDLKKLCSEIEAVLIDDLFIGYTNTKVGTEVKNYVCNAANAASPPATKTSSSSKTTTATPSCISPQGFQNTVVPVSCTLGKSSFQVSPTFTEAHQLFEITDTNILLPEADFAKFCLDQCISAKGRKCLSFFVNEGKPFPPVPGQSQAPRWYCKGYDAPLSATEFEPVNAPGSYLNGLAVNRVCGGTYRAY